MIELGLGPYAIIPEQSLWALLPMVLFIVLAFTSRFGEILTVLICCAFGFLLTGQTPAMFAVLFVESLSSTLGVIGIIIMLGAGLGAAMTKAGVSHTLVHWIIEGIGVKTQNQAIIVTIILCVVCCGLTGTLAGGLAILAPILIPLVAAVGLKPSTVGAIFQSAGEAGLIWGPFTGPVVTLLALTGLSYGQMMLWAALPFGIIWIVVIYFVAKRLQNNPAYTESYGEVEQVDVEVTPKMKRTTIAFLVAFVLLVAYNVVDSSGGTGYIVFVMIMLMLVIALFDGFSFVETTEAFSKGMATMTKTFFMFVLLNVFVEYINFGGGFEALGELLVRLIGEGGRVAIMIMGTLVGSFGINGGAVAQLQITHSLFMEALEVAQVPMEFWVLALICGSRVTSSVYPGANMLTPMGLARSNSLRAMMVGGWAVSLVSIAFIIIWSLIGLPLLFPV